MHVYVRMAQANKVHKQGRN